MLRSAEWLLDGSGAEPAGHVTVEDRSLVARRVRRMQHEREARARFVSARVAVDPAWPMLLELLASALSGKPASVKRLTYAGGVPATTALRWINFLVSEGYATRQRSERDARLTLLMLSPRGEQALRSYFGYLAECEGG